MKPLYLYSALFLSGVLVGWGPVASLTNWELSVVRKDARDQSIADGSTVTPSQAPSVPTTQGAPARESAQFVRVQSATTKEAPGVTANRSAPETTNIARDFPAEDPFHNPDEPPAFAPPPHLTDAAEFASLFEAQDHFDERIDDLEAMIAAMERDDLPEEHIAFMREAMLAEENSDPLDFEPFFDDPEPTLEDLEANIVESYGSANASPEDIEEMLDIMREDFDGSASRAAEFDLHNPPAPLEN